MLQSLKIFPILQGFRGQAGVDLPALAAALVNLSRLAVDYPEIRELDLNPVVATPQGCWCVDCRIVLGESIFERRAGEVEIPLALLLITPPTPV